MRILDCRRDSVPYNILYEYVLTILETWNIGVSKYVFFKIIFDPVYYNIRIKKNFDEER